MPKYIAFLRGLNVGGHRVKMTELCGHFEALGFSGVESFIASGNIIFESRAAVSAATERKIEAQLNKELGYAVATFVRSAAEVAALASYKPFPAAVLKSAKTVNVGFLASPPSAAAIAGLMKHQTDSDRFHAKGREVYWAGKTMMSESPFFKIGFEKVLKLPVTVRNMNTIVRLREKYGPSPKETK